MGDEREETQAETATCDAVGRLVAARTPGPGGCDPLLWELLLVWRAREYEHECLVRERLGLLFRAGAGQTGDD